MTSIYFPREDLLGLSGEDFQLERPVCVLSSNILISAAAWKRQVHKYPSLKVSISLAAWACLIWKSSLQHSQVLVLLNSILVFRRLKQWAAEWFSGAKCSLICVKPGLIITVNVRAVRNHMGIISAVNFLHLDDCSLRMWLQKDPDCSLRLFKVISRVLFSIVSLLLLYLPARIREGKSQRNTKVTEALFPLRVREWQTRGVVRTLVLGWMRGREGGTPA